MKHIICYSGGESSALAAIDTVYKFGNENVILVNHDMHFSVEHTDIKRFKREVAEYLRLPITYVNYKDASMDQFDVCVEAKAFKVGNGSELCTSRLKTGPFMKYLLKEHPEKNVICYYGFDMSESLRIQRRSQIMGVQGYATAFPLANNQHAIKTTEAIGISRPLTYDVFKHGNCIGCLKAGWQHWYIVYCTRPDIWLKGIWAEEEIGYAIHHDKTGPIYLEDMAETFEEMRHAGIKPTENVPQQKFWADAKKVVFIAKQVSMQEQLPCECVL
jgi:hypothetical protein